RYWPEAERLFWQQVSAGRGAHPARHFVEVCLSVFDQVTDVVAGEPRVARVRERSRGHILAALPRKAA
ncbi:MAG TPA: hypothetical protein VIS06_21575, partial [Mycobacteriales bacterium]